MRSPRVLISLALAAGLAVVAVLPAPSAGAQDSGTKIRVVAAENFWGSIVRQLAGVHGSVTSVISSPDTDPHDYEARPSDARAFASAQLVVVNGAGYDSWARKLLDADPGDGRRVLDVGRLVHVRDGVNPHLWYSPSVVNRVVARVTSDLRRLDPRHATYFDRRRAAFETKSLARYHALIESISQRFARAPIGASESIVTPMARALGLRLLTPESFLDAISEGADPTARDKSTADAQIEQHRIDVFVYNRQNATPDVRTLVDAAKAAGIPVVPVTETLTPARATFQAWQTRQLMALERALTRAGAA